MGETFTTSSGVAVPLKHVASRYVEAVRNKDKFRVPDAPTYTFKAAGGVEVTRPHDETTLETPEEHKAWNEYTKERLRVVMEREAEVARFLVFHCIDMDPPPVEEWSVDWDEWGLTPPDRSQMTAPEFKQAWFEHEIMADDGDTARMLAKLYEMGGLVDSDRVSEMEAFFRTYLAGFRLAGAR